MMMNVSIRLARTSDLSFLREVELSAGSVFNILPNNVPDGRTVGKEDLEAMCSAQTLWIAQEEEGKPVGFVATHPLGALFYVHELSVSFPFQKQGLGRRLMETVITHASEKAYPAVGLTTRRDVPWNKPFYESIGFIEMDESHFFPELARQLQKEIAEGADPAIRCAMTKPLL